MEDALLSNMVKHEHDTEKYPAEDQNIGCTLLPTLSPVNAWKYGVELHKDSLQDNQHTIVLHVDIQEK